MVEKVVSRLRLPTWVGFLPVLLFVALADSRAHAQASKPDTPQTPISGTGSLKGLSIEELSRIAVISASRHSEVASETAAAITVITGDALRRAGITALADALRLAVGVAVGRDGNAWAISARGFQASSTNKMVVLIDGRSVYTPLFSGVFWDVQDVLIADIDRIEVIRGAGGTLWGANAMNGVINIITKLASDTQGALVQIGGGSSRDVVGLRYGGKTGTSGTYRVYVKSRYFAASPFVDGTESEDALHATQGGARFDWGPASPTSITLQGDAYGGGAQLMNSAEDIGLGGGNVLTRIRHTYKSGAQVQLQAYYDDTYRRIPTQYTERRNTGDAELQYRLSIGARHDLVSGVGYTITHDRVTPTPVFFFDPASRTNTLINVFAQDEIALRPGTLVAVVGSKFEHNSYTGFEFQPTARLRWTPVSGQTIWGGVSRAVRMPSRFDTDLRFTGGTSTVVLRGNPDFQSETVIDTEGGYRNVVMPHVSFGVTAFTGDYDRLRSQEPTLPFGVPIVLNNLQSGRVSGIETGVHVEPRTSWQLFGGYTYLHEHFEFDPASHDPTGGNLEHNDPSHQVWFRSFSDLPGQVGFDVMYRWVAALPNPVVPSHADLSIRVARPITTRLSLEVLGDNLLHDRTLELKQLGPAHTVPRSFFIRLAWQSH